MKAEIQGDRRSLELFHAGVVRPLMLVLLVAVAWGTLLAVAFTWRAIELGLAPAFGLLVPSSGDLWGWINLTMALVAVMVWLFVAATVLGAPRKPPPA